MSDRPAAPGATPDATFLTELDERASLPYSRRLVGGNDITLDSSTPGELSVNAFFSVFFVGFGVAQQQTVVVAPPGLITTVDTSYRHLGPIANTPANVPVYIWVSIQSYVAAAQPMTLRLWLNGVGVGTKLDEAFYRSSGSTAPLDTTRITLFGVYQVPPAPVPAASYDLDVSAFYTGGGAAASGLGNTTILVTTLFPIGSS